MIGIEKNVGFWLGVVRVRTGTRGRFHRSVQIYHKNAYVARCGKKEYEILCESVCPSRA